ncbi:hypothetical protein DN752_17845 [Echinicola strongylocentroti]|uniref:Uncharacterized protein n=1 Tax=Echinicola strongylocentroti TaxID=1795355 RepID=A0A2Z4ILT1_9BACT|nr:hypothetical protein [Echinicola strongylocentroti]AWW31844.1 hypothetical protein DN752_17845 [Echinicola strongylocentroti]
MKSFTAKSHVPGRSYNQPHLFILSKGNNAGKPLESETANCFVLTFDNTEDRDRIYWLCYGLWQDKVFAYHLHGSVIPFIRLYEFRKIVMGQVAFHENRMEAFDQIVQHLKAVLAKERNLIAQQKTVAQLKAAMVRKMRKGS